MIYLDNAAIQRPRPEVIGTVMDVLMNNWGNASSAYEFGQESARIVQHTREVIAKEINCSPEEIVFCGSGSEANTLAVDGWLRANIWNNNIRNMYFSTSFIEHSSLLKNPLARRIVFCDEEGFYKMDWVNVIHGSLVSLGMANSEIGVIQDIKSITKNLHDNGCVVHTDAVACFGKIPIDVQDLGVDMLTATSQKISGILGASFLYVKKGTKLKSIIHGEQENGLRGGTYNVAAVAGLGKAVELIDFNKEKEVENKRNYLLERLLSIDGVTLNGPKDMKRRLPNNINMCIKGTLLDSQQLIALLDMLGSYCTSAGSACHSGDQNPSHVLKSIGMSDEDAKRSLRITIGEDNSYEELDKFYNDLKNIVEQYKQ